MKGKWFADEEATMRILAKALGHRRLSLYGDEILSVVEPDFSEVQTLTVPKESERGSTRGSWRHRLGDE